MWGPILSGFTILGVFLTLSAWINGRTIKKYLGGLIKETQQLIKETQELIKIEAESSRKIMEEGFRRMDDRTAKIAELIVAEGEKTRELIRALKS